MAKEKKKEKAKFSRPIVVQNTRKVKRSKHKTECSVKRIKEGCGICGSLNIAQHGVRYCMECGSEIHYLIHRPSFWQMSDNIPPLKCKCIKTASYKIKGVLRYHTYKPEKFIYVEVCMDCGATRSNYCPVCGPEIKKCWKSITGQLLCQQCNYRRNV